MRLNLKLNNNNNNKAFTLAEILIVLSVIAIITAILLPTARNAMPNKDLVKFKKGHMALVHVMQELVNSNKYYADGMLDTKPDGSLVNSPTYFCETFADVIGNVKNLNCKDDTDGGVGVHINEQWEYTNSGLIYNVVYMDDVCKQKAPIEGGQIVLANDTSWYMLSAGNYFGSNLYNDPNITFRSYTMSGYIGFPFYSLYKVFCMDIDGTPENATSNDCVNECPFGYGIRIDGKIFFSRRATDWYMKTIQEKI